MENSVLAKSMRALTAITASLKDLSLSSKFVIPNIVVAGSKCGGKSSTIEKLIGFEYLPREYNTDTQRIQFHFIFTPNLAIPEAQIVEHINKGSIVRYVDFDKLRSQINKLTIPDWNNRLPSSPIVINIYSSFMPNLTIIDLPGYSKIVINASYQSKMDQTRTMIERQIAKHDSIILGVFGANTGYLGCSIMRMMRQCDPKGFRSLAALTKVDIMDRGTNTLSVLKNEEIPLRNGYIGIKNRSSQSRKITSIQQALVEEQNFFKNSKYYKNLPREFWGTESLSLKLVEIIYEQTMKQLQNITSQLNHKIVSIKTQIQHQSNVESSEESESRMRELKAELKQLEFVQKLISDDPFFVKTLNNHKQNPQDYNQKPEILKPFEMMGPRKNGFDNLFKSPVRIHATTPTNLRIFADSEQRQAEERKKKTFLRLFGI